MCATFFFVPSTVYQFLYLKKVFTHLLSTLLFQADQLLNTLLGSVNEEQSEADIKREQAAKRKQHTEMLEERANARLLVTAKSEGDFGKLRVAQLKSILKQNYVEHDSCVEKQELVELVLELWQTSQKESAAPKEEVCKVCMDQAVRSRRRHRKRT